MADNATPTPYTDDEIRAAHAYFGLTSSVDTYLNALPCARAALEQQHRAAMSVQTLFSDGTLQRVVVPIAPTVPVGLDGHPMRPPQPIFKGRPHDGADPEPGFLFHNPA